VSVTRLRQSEQTISYTVKQYLTKRVTRRQHIKIQPLSFRFGFSGSSIDGIPLSCLLINIDMILRNFSHILLALVSIARFSSAVGVITYVGCYKASTSDLVLGQNIEDYSWQSSSHCQDVCLQALPVSPRYVLGLYMGRQCACLAAVPAPSLKVDDSNCDVNCTGFPPEMC